MREFIFASMAQAFNFFSQDKAGAWRWISLIGKEMYLVKYHNGRSSREAQNRTDSKSEDISQVM
jgi:hypothetical protein